MEIKYIEFENTLLIIKNNQKIRITPFMLEPGNIKIGIDAPRGIGVDREEIYKQRRNSLLKKETETSQRNQTIFQLLLSVTSSTEMLKHTAKQFFDKEKYFTLTSLRHIAEGKAPATAWLLSCAINILIHTKTSLIKERLSTDDFCQIWARPLLKAGMASDDVLTTAHLLHIPELTDFIKNQIL